MRGYTIHGLLAAATIVGALPSLNARQAIDFDLIDAAPDPIVAPDNSANYNPEAALAAVVADVIEDPLPQEDAAIHRRDTQMHRRDIIVETSDGFTDNIAIGNFAINAPLNCNGKDTYMGAKIFTDGPFDTKKCAMACSTQTEYNLKHPPASGLAPKVCQFYNTYASYKNGAYQGQYCALYTQSWPVRYALNKGQYRGKDSYTMRDSYIASSDSGTDEPSCPSDVPYLAAEGQAFCSSYISYIPPTSIVTETSTPPATTLVSTRLSVTTIPTTVEHTSVVVSTSYTTFPYNLKRAVATPLSISSWSPSRISAACSAVATGTVTNTNTLTLDPSIVTSYFDTTSTAAVTTDVYTTLTSVVTVPTMATCPYQVALNDGFEQGLTYGQNLGQYAFTTLESNGLTYVDGTGALIDISMQNSNRYTPHSGSYSLAVQHGASTWRGLTRKVRLCPNTVYYYSVWVRHSNAGTIRCDAGIRINGVEPTDAFQGVADQWTLFSTSANSGAGGTILVALASYCYGASQVRWDDFVISTTPVTAVRPVPVVPQSLPTCPRTVIVQDDFENGVSVGRGAGQWDLTTYLSHGLDYTVNLSQSALIQGSAPAYTPLTGRSALVMRFDSTTMQRTYPGNGMWYGVMTKARFCANTDYYWSAWVKKLDRSQNCYAGMRVNGYEFFWGVPLSGDWQFLAGKFNSGNLGPDREVLVGLANLCFASTEIMWDSFTISTTPVTPLQNYNVILDASWVTSDPNRRFW